MEKLLQDSFYFFLTVLLLCRYQNAIPPSPPAEEVSDSQRPGIRFQVTLEEGEAESESEAPM